MRYSIGVVHQDGDGVYGAHFPDVRGYFPAADDSGDLSANANEALSPH